MKTVFDELNSGEKAAVATLAGSVLIIAGPGSRKTLTLVRRVMNVLVSELARPEEIVLCTFTEKAALELQNRVRKAASDLGYMGDMSGLRVGTLHGIAHEFVDFYRHRTPLASNFEVLENN